MAGEDDKFDSSPSGGWTAGQASMVYRVIRCMLVSGQKRITHLDDLACK